MLIFFGLGMENFAAPSDTCLVAVGNFVVAEAALALASAFELGNFELGR